MMLQNNDKLPLGKLSKATLKAGFAYLQEIDELIQKPALAQKKYGQSQQDALAEISSKYYTTIPHISGRQRLPVIDNNNLVTSEAGMLVRQLRPIRLREY